MADAKRIAKQILYVFGKGLYYVGKGLWLFIKAVGKGIQASYRRYEEQQRLQAIRQAELWEIEEENRSAGRGWTRGMADVRGQERIRQRNERDRRGMLRRFEKSYNEPKVNDSFLTEGFPANSKRKKRRSIF